MWQAGCARGRISTWSVIADGVGGMRGASLGEEGTLIAERTVRRSSPDP